VNERDVGAIDDGGSSGFSTNAVTRSSSARSTMPMRRAMSIVPTSRTATALAAPSCSRLLFQNAT
jgi:hypothetical protein